MRRGKFAGYVGRVAEYAVYFEGDKTLLYRDKEETPCFENESYTAAEKFAGVIGYKPTSRGPMPQYAE